MIEALGIMMAKNEADVVEAFVRHNLNFMDALVIIDNDSVDDTRKILVQLQQEGLPIILFDDPVVGHFQAEIVTAVYRKVVPKFEPRFVFLLDADEFVVASSREDLYAQLRGMRPGTQAQYSLQTYVPAPTGPLGDTSDPLRSITYRKATEQRMWWKSVIVTDPKIDMKLKIKQGNHGVKYAGRSLRKVKLRNVTLAHFPVRSIDQYTAKILVGWIANMERNRYLLDGAHGIHWKRSYERIIRGTGLTAEDLTREAFRYAQLSETESEWPRDVVCDPVMPGYASLTAQSTAACTPLQKVVRSFDKIFNPEADGAYLAPGIEFLETSNGGIRAWRNVVRPFTADGKSAADSYIDLPPFRYLAERYCPVSVLDIGCGSGAYLKYFASQGAERITGVDSSEGRARYLELDEYVRADLGKPLELAQTYDLVMCLGAAQHINADSEHTFVGSVTRHARERIVFSGDWAGQAGAGRGNGRATSHWLDLFASTGWYPSLFDSLALQSLSTSPWLRSNLVVFTRDDADAAVARERLIKNEQGAIKGKRHRPAVITHSFTETENRLLARRDSRTVAMANTFLRALISRLFD